MENRIDIKVIDFLDQFNLENYSNLKKKFKNYIRELMELSSFTTNKEDYLWFLVTSCYESYLYINNMSFKEKKLIDLQNRFNNKLLKIIHKNLKKSENFYRKWIRNKNRILPDKNVIVKVEDAYKYYSSNKMASKILNNINFEIYNGDFVVILGPSGSGKTTLMNLISGMEKPSFGKIWVDGYHLEEMNNMNLTQFRKNVIGYVFQRYGLLPNLTVFENVLLGEYLGRIDPVIFELGLHKRSSYSFQKITTSREMKKVLINKERMNIEENINKILKDLELYDFAKKYPYELSGGQKQRTSIARTIAKKPRIIFGDEPTGAVDSEMSKSIIEIFSKINNDLKTTIIIITHDETIAQYANKVIYVNDGKIERILNKDKGKMVEDENKKDKKEIKNISKSKDNSSTSN